MQDASAPPEPEIPAEPRQRWRLVVARDEAAAEQTQRELGSAWEAGLEAAGLPLARNNGRPRISFGAPLPVGMAARAELVDVVLTERWPAWRLREAVEAVVPAGWRLVDAHDVWLAGPPLAGRVLAADYLVRLADDAPGDLVGRLGDAASALVAARRLERQRTKGGGLVTYDLRPLLLDVSVDVGPQTVIRARTRIHPELGTGRPEEVVAALGDYLGVAIPVASIVRERLWLADDLETDVE